MVLCRVFYLRRGALRRTGREKAWKGKRSALLILSCIGIALLVSPSAYALRQMGQKNIGPSSAARLADTVVKGQTVVCPEEPAAAAKGTERGSGVTKFAATLSETEPKVSLQCGGTTAVAPKKILNGMVCPADVPSEDLTKCVDPSDLVARSDPESRNAVSLSGLMGGDPTTSPVKWVESTPGTGDVARGKIYTLSLPESPLPLLDSTFLTGCLKNTATHCVLTVTVEARKSAGTGQTVNCAYGANSNPNDKRPTVTITGEKNTLTLVCGSKDATPIPGDRSAYCTDNDAACKTTQKYTALVPGFEESWWQKSEPGTWTLTIPKEQIPSSLHTIHIGCRYNPQSEGEARTINEGPTACMVDVVLGTPGDSSAAATSGAVTLGVAVALTALNASFPKSS